MPAASCSYCPDYPDREVAAETVTAVDCTAALDQQQCAIAVFVQQARHHATLLIERIGGEPWGVDELSLAVSTWRSSGSLASLAHARSEGARHAQGEQPAGIAPLRQFRVRIQ